MVAIATMKVVRWYVPTMKLSPCFLQHNRTAVSDHGLNITDDAIVIACRNRRQGA
jgi:hypothetical protein